jgi:DNA-binding CsgD family transcriptional regulator
VKPGTAVRLTEHEQRILGLIAIGLGSKAIAQRIGGSPATVDNHRGRICAKLGADNAAHCVWRGIAEGYLQPPEHV